MAARMGEGRDSAPVPLPEQLTTEKRKARCRPYDFPRKGRIQPTTRKTKSKLPPTSSRRSGITTLPETGTRTNSTAMIL